MRGESAHVTVVFAGQSESWARWIEYQVRVAGRATALVRWDPLRRPPTPEALTDLLSAPGRVLLVIDDWYERLGKARFEAWGSVLRDALPHYQGRIAAVSVTEQPLPDAVIPLAPVALRGLPPEVARSRVLECAGIGSPEPPVVLDRGPRFPDYKPQVVNAPRANRRFLGRAELLQRMYDAFRGAGEGITSVVLHGPGGIGKTQLAQEYADRFGGDYDIIWWAGATNRLTAREKLAALAPELGLDTHGELGADVRAVRRRLGSTSQPWLLVLDAADAPGKLSDLIPEGDGAHRGHVLITSLDTEWAKHAEAIAVPPFDRTESVAFAVRRTERLAEEDADRLAAAVQDLPLLLDQTTAWLDLNPMADVHDYIRDIERGEDRIGAVESPDYQQNYQVVWAKLLNTLRQDSQPAWQLLNLLACFSPEVVPVRLLQTTRAGELPPALADLVSEPSSWNSALRKLSEITSMRVEYEEGPRDIQVVRTLRMHRLFHRYVRSVQAPDDAARNAEVARRVLVSADPRDTASPGNWNRYADLIPHLDPSHALQSRDEDVRGLVLNCIEYLRTRGEHTDGRRLSRQAVDAWQDEYGPTDRSVLVAVHQLANNLRSLGRYAEAEDVGREVHDRLAAAPEGVGPIELIRAKDGLGGTLMALARFDEARALFEDAAARATAELGGEDVPRTLSIRSNLAVAIGLQGHYAQAHALHRKIFETRVRLLGDKNALTLNSALRTAWMLRLLGRYREALAIQGHNSRLHRQVLDRRHSQTLEAEHNYALCARREGDLAFARSLMRAVRERVVGRRGELHPESLLVSCDYAMLLRELGHTQEALELAEATAGRYADLHGESHPYAIGARDNVATVLRQRGDVRAACRISEETAREMARAVGAGHPWAVGCAKNSMTALAATEQYEAAARTGRAALDASAATLGESHVLTVSLRVGLAGAQRVLGEEQEADELFRRASDQLTQLLGADHQQTRYILEQRLPYWDFEPQPI
ncbi:FxSxx-COOH system tetratricopeptide repeat protein [Streptomyces sp. NPDC046716]|uniref:FxSxx-COOH system tetratricopeptide repeat protein n=1 Tax=Streptomyces sp. NPDC046716 TaxID=3157093 RepID=UPI0033F75CD5